jgi:hypothetical protein
MSEYPVDARPLVVVNITGGVEQWTITAPGTGEPVVLILDFDDEAELEWREDNLARYREAFELAKGRVDLSIELSMAEGIADEQSSVEALRLFLVSS